MTSSLGKCQQSPLILPSGMNCIFSSCSGLSCLNPLACIVNPAEDGMRVATVHCHLAREIIFALFVVTLIGL